ncbi:proteasome regulatory particle base subunit, partial [Rhizophlyctis rosea]
MASMKGTTRWLLASVLVLLLQTQFVFSASAVIPVPPNVAPDFINANLHRVIDLTGPIVREHTTIIVKGIRQSGSADSYFLSFKEQAADNHLAWLEVEEKGGKPLLVAKDVTDGQNGIQYYKVKLAAPLKADDKATLIVKASYAKRIEPFPKEISQVGKQMFLYRDNVHLYSPYQSEKQKTTVKTKTTEAIARDKSGSSRPDRSSNTLVYGPYTDLPPFAELELDVHYADPEPILVAKEHRKNAVISHWSGQLAVQEDYEVHHKGASLKGQWSRIDYQLTQRMHDNTNVVKGLQVQLPPQASNIFFRDTIGNVSTSRVAHDRRRTVLYLKPRYPLYGGWRYTWHHGYHAPLENFLKRDEATGRYVFRVAFTGGMSNLTVEHAVLSVVLPEGARNIDVKSAFNLDGISNTTTYTFLDTTGRPTVVLQKVNAVDEHALPIEISYDYSPISLLQKPLAVSVAFLLVFLTGAVYSRLDLGITKNPAREAETLLRSYRQTVTQTQTLTKSLFTRLTTAFETYKATKELSTYHLTLADVEAALGEAWKRLEGVAERAEKGGNEVFGRG